TEGAGRDGGRARRGAGRPRGAPARRGPPARRRTRLAGGGAARSQRGGDLLEDPVEGRRRAHHRGGLLRVRAVVAADVGRLALHREELLGDGLLTLGELLRDRAEGGGELGVLALGGQLLRPVQGEVEMAAAVVDAAEL